MALKELSRTGLTTMEIKNPLPDVVDGTEEDQVGFIPSERASTSLVAGQTEVNPLATDLPDTQLMNALTNYTNVNFNSSLVDSTVIGSSRYMTAGGIRKDATTSDNILPGDTFSEQDDFYTQISEAMGDTWKGSGAQQAADIYAGGNLLGEFDTSYTPSAFATTSDFVQAFQSAPVVENITDYKTVTPPVNLWGAGAMVWNTLTENAFIKGVKNNPSKYMNNDKYVKDAEGWFAKQAHKQFGAIFEENPTSALRVAEANKALYEYLQSTQAGRQKARDMGLNLDNINKNYEQAKSFETSANNIAQSYSAYQTGGDYDVSTKNTAYANMSQSDLDDTNPAGHNQYSGMPIGGNGVYVDISDGIASGTSFASGTIFVKWKKEERERRAKEAAAAAAEAEAAAAEAEAAEAAAAEAAAAEAAAEAEPTGDDGWQPDYAGAVADQQQQAAEAGQTHEQFMSDLDAVMAKGGLVSGPPGGHHWQEGGRVSFQAGGPTGNPMGQQQEQQQPIQDAGNLELVQEQGKDQSGVADDVKRDLNEGDFVINAPAMEMAGRGDIERMIMKAVTELQRKGVKLDFGQAAEDADSIVQALVSNKEMIIPKVIAEQIGYDRLEKINNRGKERVDEIEKEKAQQQKGFIQPNPQGQSPQPVQVGGQITLEENKNQPIAVPRESFATMSPIGKRLLSPLSPEQADKELTELSKPSQSFEGFLKPVKMNEGGKTDKEVFMDNLEIPLSVDANNWFSIHSNPGIDWEGRKKPEDKKHEIIEEFYDPKDSARAIYRNLWTRNLRNNRGSTFKVSDVFDKTDAFGAYAEDPKPYFDTMADFGYTKDSIIDLRDKESMKKFFGWLAAIEVGREYYSKHISPEEKKRVIDEGIDKGLESLMNDENYKYREQFINEMNKPLISVEFTGDKQQRYGGMLSVN